MLIKITENEFKEYKKAKIGLKIQNIYIINQNKGCPVN